MTGKPRRPAVGTRGSGHRSGAVESAGGALVWSGFLPRFAPVRQGGPGRPLTLAIIAGAGITMAYVGMRMVERSGNDGSGPALVLLGLFLVLFLALWLLIKAGLRGREVTFIINENGVGIQPSVRQRTVDRRMGLFTRLVFLFTWRGGQWSAWAPFTDWRAVRSVAIDAAAREILDRGAWDIRLACAPESFAHIVALIRDRVWRFDVLE